MWGKQIDVVCLTEKWLANSKILSIDGCIAYNLLRKSLDQKEVCHDEGVNMPSQVVVSPIPKFLELYVLWVWVRLRFVYYPPKAPFGKSLVNDLQLSVDHFWTIFTSASIVICGDFSDIKPSLLESCLSAKQVVKSPTRGSYLYDMVFTNLQQYYK